MIINVKSGSGGFAKYVLEGTNANPRDKSKIEAIGDPFFVEKIAKLQGSGYFRILVSAEKKLSNAEMKQILDEALKNIFIGLNPDEYTYSAVLHQDTDHSHWHIIVSKKNLLTGQQLRLYMQGVDTKRFQALQDYIALKHNLKTIKETKQTTKSTKYAFEKQRAERGQKPFIFTFINRKERKKTEQELHQLLKDNIKQYNSLNEMKQFIEKNSNLKVVNNGHDRKKDFHYITVQDKNGKKLRVKGEMFAESFFTEHKIKQKALITLNYKPIGNRERLLNEVRAILRQENEKRYKTVQKLFKKGRERARKQLKQIYIKGAINEYTKPQQTVARLHQPTAKQTKYSSENMQSARNGNAENVRKNGRGGIDYDYDREAKRRAKERKTAQLTTLGAVRKEPEGIYRRATKDFAELGNKVGRIHGERKSRISGFGGKIRELGNKIREFGEKIIRHLTEIAKSAEREQEQSADISFLIKEHLGDYNIDKKQIDEMWKELEDRKKNKGLELS